MTDSQMDAPDRIWVEYGQSGPEAMVWVGGSTIGLRKLPCYILATPEVLAVSPEVKALIAAERERCAGECDRTAREADMFGDKHGRQISERTAAALRGETP